MVDFILCQIPLDTHVLSAEILHDGNTVEVRFSACTDLALIDFRYFLGGQLAVTEILGRRFAVVPGPVTESVTDLCPATGFLNGVQLRLVGTQLPCGISHLGAIEIGVPRRIPHALRDTTSLLLKGPRSFSVPVLQHIVDRLVEQAGDSPSLTSGEDFADRAPVTAGLFNSARVGTFKHLLELFERVIDELSLGLRSPCDAGLTLKCWLGQLFFAGHFEPFPSVGDSRSDR